MRIKSLSAANPERFAKALVACLGADKGIPATAEPLSHGAWVVNTSTLRVEINLNLNTSMAHDRLVLNTLCQ